MLFSVADVCVACADVRITGAEACCMTLLVIVLNRCSNCGCVDCISSQSDVRSDVESGGGGLGYLLVSRDRRDASGVSGG